MSICRDKIKRDGIENLFEWLEKSDFFIAPASTRFHGAYESGLLEHSLNVYDSLTSLNAQYGGAISDETIAICALFHDVCKANTYKKGTKRTKDEDTGEWYDKEIYFRDEVFPIGHGEKSCIILQWFIKLTVPELLAIRHHMGGFDSAVKGGDYSMNKAYDTNKLSAMLHIADMQATYLMEERNG